MFKSALLIAILACCVLTTGCQKIAEQDQNVFDRYYLTRLKLSKSADILPVLTKDRELVSQSESVVASWDQEKDNALLWFNMVTFDEEQLSAVRKYAFMIDEKARGYHIAPTQKLRFDGSVVVPADILAEPYANENARRIAIIKQIQKSFTDDASQIETDSSSFEAAGMMIKQVLNHIVYKLDRSPALAARLSDYEGMEFDHMIFDKGRVRLVIEDDIAKIKVKIGSIAKDFEEQDDVIAM